MDYYIAVQVGTFADGKKTPSFQIYKQVTTELGTFFRVLGAYSDERRDPEVQEVPELEGNNWTRDFESCQRLVVLLNSRNSKPPPMAIIEFYRGSGVDGAGRTIEEVLSFTHDQMEEVHDYIQWLFPLPEPSQWQPQSPILTEAELEVFRTDKDVRRRVLEAYGRWTDFAERTVTEWKIPLDHNHLRITRIIRFLNLVGFNARAELLHRWASRLIVPPETRRFWDNALKSQ